MESNGPEKIVVAPYTYYEDDNVGRRKIIRMEIRHSDTRDAWFDNFVREQGVEATEYVRSDIYGEVLDRLRSVGATLENINQLLRKNAEKEQLDEARKQSEKVVVGLRYFVKDHT